ncbi:DNRLRE domain-containing protein [Solirubrobacter phytolaccae]|uniref:DNRLRE domain-containing protein n=1 Tax=Solirubrobacter phytolaccae TaxID=1404360 RepID=A0A9X3N8T0_9ACTN|nr:DNRLRE domain-containing protein [Solirubrobacter phytolaccae]MDA0181913.1 DNRLRE domain-containing protein [Solirubrobacter phytolaccae]
MSITADQWCTIDSPDSGGCEGAMVGTDGDPPGVEHRALLGFDIAAEVPSGSEIIDATLSFVAPDPGGDPFCVFCTITGGAIASAWDPAYVTWTERTSTQSWTSAGGDIGTAITLIDSFGNAVLDATDAVAEIVSGAEDNNGFLVKSDNEDFALAIDTWSLNGKPQLAITYEPPGPRL